MESNKNMPTTMLRLLSTLLFIVLSANVYAEEVETKKPVVAMEPASMGNLLEVTFGLLVVLILIFSVAWFAKRYGSFNSTVGGSLRIVGGLSLGQKERVVLVQVGDKQMLLGVAPGRVEILHVLDEAIVVDSSLNKQENFSERLQAALTQRLKK